MVCANKEKTVLSILFCSSIINICANIHENLSLFFKWCLDFRQLVLRWFQCHCYGHISKDYKENISLGYYSEKHSSITCSNRSSHCLTSINCYEYLLNLSADERNTDKDKIKENRSAFDSLYTIFKCKFKPFKDRYDTNHQNLD